jgi:tRNA dimethylallyltransferase
MNFNCLIFIHLKIDSLLQEDIIPILVGGTHYYIHAVLSDILIDNESTMAIEKKRKLLHNEDDSSVFKLIKECHEKNQDLNVFLHDSNITNKEFYEQLMRVDMQSAQKIHPNDRRKLVRLLSGLLIYNSQVLFYMIM